MEAERIRNFVIIAHVDHGKSTLADRLLEITGTVEVRRMRAQYLDQLELERERGITIKMAPVRMTYQVGSTAYTLNLIDTPGHSDFSYEVSRSLAAVEGAILLVDATQGIQAQTLANLRLAQASGLAVIGAVNKIDLLQGDGGERLEGIVHEVASLLSVAPGQIHRVSGKTGEGVSALIEAVVALVPPPRSRQSERHLNRALIFDSFFNDHKGVVASVRVFEGAVSLGAPLYLVATRSHSKVKELGYFTPELRPLVSGGAISVGEIGYVATGLRDPELVKIGDTLIAAASPLPRSVETFALTGYRDPQPVVFVSFYPEENDEHERLYRSLERLRLNDASLTIEPDQNEVLGRGFKVGFLGRLHFEVTAERLRREFGVPTVSTFPSVLYRVRTKVGWGTIVKPEELPADYIEIQEPTIAIEVIVPGAYLSNVLALQRTFRMTSVRTESVGDRIKVSATMPLVELVSDFDDQLKSSTQGLASFSYALSGYVAADVVRVDVLVAGTVLPGLSRFVPRPILERECHTMVERLKVLLPRAQFSQAIQASADGKIVAREDVPALRKDVTGYLYGGDRTRKMKLWKKQSRGKRRLKERAEHHARLSPEVFKELMRK